MNEFVDSLQFSLHIAHWHGNFEQKRGVFQVEQKPKNTQQKFEKNIWIGLEEDCEFENVTQAEFLFSKIICSVTDEKLRQKILNQNQKNVKLTMNRNGQDIYTKNTVTNLSRKLKSRKKALFII